MPSPQHKQFRDRQHRCAPDQYIALTYRSVMAKARALDKRRKSIRNIRKITRTMELIATARFKKAMDRAHAATAYTKRITQLGGRSGQQRLGSQPSAA